MAVPAGVNIATITSILTRTTIAFSAPPHSPATLMFRLLLLSLLPSVLAFQSPAVKRRSSIVLRQQTSQDSNGGNWNPLKEFSDILNNFDDVIDDFMNKRMGNGEVFYGKRKYKPSGRLNTDGYYNGMGLSDKVSIDISRARKEEFLEMKRQREEAKRKNK